MTDVINSLFGRSRTATPGSGEEVETAPIADYAVDSTEDTPADNDAENSGNAAESAEVDESADDNEPATDETDAEESEEPATEEAAEATEANEDGDADEDGDAEEDGEPVAETDDAPAAAETADADDDTDAAGNADTHADADADDADDDARTEPVVVPVVVPVAAETRPDAGARGSVTVGEGVVAKVVNIVVGKIDGVHGLDGTLVELADDVATVKISLVVEFGHAIKALAERIRIDVIEAVEQFLGLDVAAVDVHVSDIHAA